MWRNLTGLAAVVACAGLMTGTGTSAQARSAPAAGPTGAYLTGADCLSPGFCMVVGGDDGAALAARWNGSAWTVLPVQGGKNLPLYAVWCVSSTACVAAGDSGQATFLARWNGSTWRELPDSATELLPDGFSCSSLTDCVGLGGSSTELTEEQWNGHAWTAGDPYYPGGPANAWGGVDCVRTSYCMVVGSGWIDDETEVAFADGGNGSQWDGPLNVVQQGDEPALDAVSCLSAADCVAVGNTGAVVMSERWNGTAWRSLMTPGPGHPGNLPYLKAVSCPSPTRCLALGAVADEPGSFAEVLNGQTWTRQKLVDPGDVSLAAVSCGATRSCLAVGSSTSGGKTHARAEIWNGSTWQAQPFPSAGGLPPDFGFDALQGLPLRRQGAGRGVHERGRPADEDAWPVGGRPGHLGEEPGVDPAPVPVPAVRPLTGEREPDVHLVVGGVPHELLAVDHVP
jgi:hypothetical protein